MAVLVDLLCKDSVIKSGSLVIFMKSLVMTEVYKKFTWSRYPAIPVHFGAYVVVHNRLYSQPKSFMNCETKVNRKFQTMYLLKYMPKV